MLDPQVLCAQQVRDLYAQRWRIEEAFLLTKRLLGLAYLWVIVNLTPHGYCRAPTRNRFARLLIEIGKLIVIYFSGAIESGWAV